MKELRRKIERLEKLAGKDKTAAQWYASPEGKNYQEALIMLFRSLATGNKDIVAEAQANKEKYKMPEYVSEEIEKSCCNIVPDNWWKKYLPKQEAL